MTLQDHWRVYRDACYPQGIFGTQNRECHQAFFAGALVALHETTALAALPDDEALKRLEILLREAEEICRVRATGRAA